MQYAKQVLEFAYSWLPAAILAILVVAVLGGVAYGVVSEITDCDDRLCSEDEAYACGYLAGQQAALDSPSAE